MRLHSRYVAIYITELDTSDLQSEWRSHRMDSQTETQGSEPAPMECRSLTEGGCGHGQLERENGYREVKGHPRCTLTHTNTCRDVQ